MRTPDPPGMREPPHEADRGRDHCRRRLARLLRPRPRGGRDDLGRANPPEGPWGDSSIVMGAASSGEPTMTFRRSLGGKSYSMEMRMFVADDGVPVLVFEDQAGVRRY